MGFIQTRITADAASPLMARNVVAMNCFPKQFDLAETGINNLFGNEPTENEAFVLLPVDPTRLPSIHIC